jgi:membrane-bound lytic murein transglycosylase
MTRVAALAGWLLFLALVCLPATSWSQTGGVAEPTTKDRELLEKWQHMKESEKQELRERYQNWKNLKPEEKEELQRNMETWRKARPEEKAAIRRNFEAWQKLKQGERQELRERWQRWRDLPEEIRHRRLALVAVFHTAQVAAVILRVFEKAQEI